MSEPVPGGHAFALTGLTSRGGLSNWVFFFLPDELVMVDVGLAPAVKAGAQAGVLGGLGGAGHALLDRHHHGPAEDRSQEVSGWCTELRGKSKHVIELPDAQILRLELKMQMTAHELRLTGEDGVGRKYGLMNRAQAEAVAPLLAEKFDERFELAKTGTFTLFERYAPFLL